MNGAQIMYSAVDEPEDWKTLGEIDADEFHESFNKAGKAVSNLIDTMNEFERDSKKLMNDIRSEDFYNRGGPGDFRKRGRKR